MSFADLTWEELPYIINKLHNLGLSDVELKNLSYQERRNLLINNPVLLVWHFQHKIEVFFKGNIVDGPLGKKNTLHVLIFKKGVAHMIICSYGFIMHQILKMKLHTLHLLGKQ